MLLLQRSVYQIWEFFGPENIEGVLSWVSLFCSGYVHSRLLLGFLERGLASMLGKAFSPRWGSIDSLHSMRHFFSLSRVPRGDCILVSLVFLDSRILLSVRDYLVSGFLWRYLTCSFHGEERSLVHFAPFPVLMVQAFTNTAIMTSISF